MLKPIPKCIQCETTESSMWRSVEMGHICHHCYEQNRNNLKNELEPDTNDNSNGEEKRIRKSTRSTRYKNKTSGTTGGTTAAGGTTVTVKTIPKGKGRRCIFKKNPQKAPTLTATTTSVDHLFYKGSYVQIGDIVSLIDAKQNLYYAQIRGLLIDTYCEKSAVITWLIPTRSSPPPNERFDPATYLIGPDEEQPRKLSCMEFVMHAPSNYFHNKTTPYPPPDDRDYESGNTNFIWTTLGETKVI